MRNDVSTSISKRTRLSARIRWEFLLTALTLGRYIRHVKILDWWLFIYQFINIFSLITLFWLSLLHKNWPIRYIPLFWLVVIQIFFICLLLQWCTFRHHHCIWLTIRLINLNNWCSINGMTLLLLLLNSKFNKLRFVHGFWRQFLSWIT